MTETSCPPEIGVTGIKRIELEDGKSFLIAVAQNKKELELRRRLIQQINGQFPVKEIELEDSIVIVEGNQLEIYGEPRQSKSADSQASYIFRSKYASPAVQGYVLRYGEHTSYHHHEEHVESLRLIHGDATIILNEIELPINETVPLMSNTRHLVRGGPGGAFIVVATAGSEDCFDMRDHHYHPIPEFT